jgi:uncharacterized membrane protein
VSTLAPGRTLAVALALVSSFWAVALLGAPYAASRGGGSDIRPATAFVYLLGRFVCHQRSDRSFHVGTVQLPVCSRCTGLYLSAPFGALLALTPRPRRVGYRRLRVVLLAAALPLAIAWLIEAVGLVAPTNTHRLLSALPLGFVTCWVVARAVDQPPEVN